jgi:hypothetical protein
VHKGLARTQAQTHETRNAASQGRRHTTIFKRMTEHVVLNTSLPEILRKAVISDRAAHRRKLLETPVNDLTVPINGIPAIVKAIDGENNRLIITVNKGALDGRKVPYTPSI